MYPLHSGSRRDPRRRATARPRRRDLRLRILLAGALVVASAALLYAPTAGAQVGSLSATSFLRDALQPAKLPLRQLGLSMAISLAVLELVAASFKWMRGDRPRFDVSGYHLMIRFAWWSLVFTAIVLTANNPSQVLLEGAEEIANGITGLDGFNPTNIVAQGHFLFGEYVIHILDDGILGSLLFSHVSPLVLSALSAFVIVICYYVVALTVYLLLFQATLTLALHPLFWAFGASRWTAPLFDAYVSFLLFLSFKTLLIALLIKAGDGITFWIIQLIDSVDATSVLFATDAPIKAVVAALGYAVGAMSAGAIASRLAGRLSLASTLLRQDA